MSVRCKLDKGQCYLNGKGVRHKAEAGENHTHGENPVIRKRRKLDMKGGEAGQT
jgi:hypothetical protein